MNQIAEGFSVALSLLRAGDPETYSSIYITLATSGLAMVGVLLLGAPLGFCVGYFNFPGRKAVKLLLDTALSVPTVVIGLLVYLLLSRMGPLGGLGLLFTIPGMAVGLVLLGLPIMIAHTALAVERADARLRLTLLTLGAQGPQLLLATLREARHQLGLAAVVSFGRIVSEVGIAMMVGGNIKWHTRTITTAISLETGKGEYSLSIALGLVLLAIALLLNLTAALARRRAGL